MTLPPAYGITIGGIHYSTSEQDTGLKWLSGETIYQKTVDFGALPATATKNVPHGIVNLDVVIDFWGVAKNPANPSWVSLNREQHSSNLEVDSQIFDGNIRIVTLVDYSTFTSCFVTIIYTKA